MPKKPFNPQPINAAFIEEIQQAVGDLIIAHANEIQDVIELSDTRMLNISFGVKLDFTETAPGADVVCRFASKVTDRRSITCDDPDQMTFSMVGGAVQDFEGVEQPDEPEQTEPQKRKSRKASRGDQGGGTENGNE